MRHHNSLFHQLLQFVPWDRFDRLVDLYGADSRVRRLTTKSQLIALLYAQLSGAQSLREIEQSLASQAHRLYHLGARRPARSTLADANAKRPAQLFADLFALLVSQATPGLRRATRQAIHLVDATSIRLTDLSRAWADYEKHGALVKLHIDFDAGAQVPANFAITPARLSDVTVAHGMPVEHGATYVFDLGYYDFSWWKELHEAGCRIVTRLKSHTRPRVIESRPVTADGVVETDQIIAIAGRLKSARGARHPLDGITLREVVIVIETGRTLRLLTNDLDSPAELIAAFYKTRWQVEALLPLGQAAPQDQALSRRQRERRACPTRRRTDRLHHHQTGAESCVTRNEHADPRKARSRQPHASPAARSARSTATAKMPRSQTARATPMLNRTAVGLSRGPIVRRVRNIVSDPRRTSAERQGKREPCPLQHRSRQSGTRAITS